MGRGTFPRGPEGITTGWLADAVGAPVSAFEVEQIGMGVGLLGRMYRLTLSGDASTPSSVVLKMPTLDQRARANIMKPMHFYEREVSFYQEAARAVPVATPKVHFAEFDPATDDFVLVFEDCSDRRMADQIAGCSNADADTAIDAMVALHAHSWAALQASTYPWLPKYCDSPYPQAWGGMFERGWPRAREIFGARMPEPIRDFGDHFERIVQPYLDEISAEPVTFCHGDFRLDNFLFRTKKEHAPMTIVDWPICFRGRGAYDLGYFISQSLTAEDRRANEKRLIDRYTHGLAAHGVEYPRDQLMRDYKRTVAWCFLYPVAVVGSAEIKTERQLQLLQGMLDRSIAAIEDSGALEVLR
ncbi:ecdysteroid 22-kinase family protein [Pendulispora rubella]|uniref:Ecdysteroid 22-kinase family protein n=1 Tax=Pendulispora rubella TaxID=2741070 RepID=A0ABZ2L562_9BACT